MIIIIIIVHMFDLRLNLTLMTINMIIVMMMMKRLINNKKDDDDHDNHYRDRHHPTEYDDEDISAMGMIATCCSVLAHEIP